MKWLKAGIGLVVLVSAVLLAVSALRPTDGNDHNLLRYEAAQHSREFELLVADDQSERVQGLSNHDSLGSDMAMLFVFDKPGLWGIWMKDMSFSIDIVWLDADKRITHIEESVAPETYPTVFRPPVESRYVVEFNAGVSDELGLSPGDSLHF